MFARRSVLSDVPAILALVDPGALDLPADALPPDASAADITSAAMRKNPELQSHPYFGHQSLPQLFYNSLLAVTILIDDERTGQERIIGFAAITDSPSMSPVELIPIPSPTHKPQDSSAASHEASRSLSTRNWYPAWFQPTYVRPAYEAETGESASAAPLLDLHNSAWLASLVADPLHEAEVVEAALQSVFATLPHLDGLLAFVPPGDLEPALGAHTSLHDVLRPLGQGSTDKLPADSMGAPRVQFCPRSCVIPDVAVRAARVEDHDDLLPVFEEQSQVLTQQYGAFFLASLIEAQGDTNHALVLEANHTAVGLVCLTGDIDIDMLCECFDLASFDYLQREFVEPPAAPVTADGYGVPLSPRPNARLANDNAFAITMCGIDAAFEERAADFIGPAFELYPDREFCILTTPHDAPEVPFLSQFTLVESFPSSTLGHVLYVVHRSSVFASPHMVVDLGTEDDHQAVTELLGGVVNGDSLSALFADAVAEAAMHDRQLSSVEDDEERPPRSHALVARCDGQLIGFFLLRDTDDALYQARRLVFATDQATRPGDTDLSDEEQGQFPQDGLVQPADLLYFILNPTFSPHTRLFLQEAMRLTNKNCLFLTIQPDELVQPVVDLFVQVPPREALPLEGPAKEEEEEEDGDDGALMSARHRYSLYTLTRSQLYEPKKHVNSRIVIVGASDTGISCLEQLLLQPHLNFSHLTLVSDGGLPLGRPDSEESELLCDSSPYDSALLSQLGLANRVRLINETVVEFDAQDQVVKLGNNALVSYDMLVLCPGLQDPIPNDCAEFRLAGVYSLSNEATVRAAFEFVQSLQRTQPVIVHGATLEALAAIRGLVDLGVHAEDIIWVTQSGPDDADWCRGQEPIHKAVYRGVTEELGISHVMNMEIIAVEHAGARVSSVSLRRLDDGDDSGLDPRLRLLEARGGGGGDASGGDGPATGAAVRMTAGDDMVDSEAVLEALDMGDKVYTLGCNLLLTAHEVDVDRDIYHAVASSSLVYDGRLVVDSLFATANPAIYAAGPVAKFSRRHGGKRHELFDSREVGAHVANSLLDRVDPTRDDVDVEQARRRPPREAPAMDSAPKVQAARLLPDLHYFGIVSTKQAVPLTGGGDGTGSHHIQPKVLTTEGADGRFCRMVFGEDGCLHSMFYLGSEALPVRLYARLIGLSVSYFNQLWERYDQMEVPDLFDDLLASWTSALYHEDFGAFRQSLVEQLMQDDKLRSLIVQDEAGDINVTRLSALLNQFPEESRRYVMHALLRFVKDRAHQLPAYGLAQ